LSSHLIEPALVRADAFADFMVDRQKRLLDLIERATGKAAYIGDIQDEGDDAGADGNAVETD